MKVRRVRRTESWSGRVDSGLRPSNILDQTLLKSWCGADRAKEEEHEGRQGNMTEVPICC